MNKKNDKFSVPGQYFRTWNFDYCTQQKHIYLSIVVPFSKSECYEKLLYCSLKLEIISILSVNFLGGPVLYWHAQHFIPGYTINVVLLFLLHTYIIYITINRMGRSSSIWQWHYDMHDDYPTYILHANLQAYCM